ncbi:MAG: formyltransferase family protein [Patescibacteria group bacterium]|jgi:phosphoribosylglycinamide formyltransferase-1
MQPLYNKNKGVMNVAGFMSGSGTNLRKIIEHEKNTQPNYHVTVIFSDCPDSNAEKIGKDYNIPVIIHDKKVYYAKRNKPLRDLAVRAEFDSETVQVLKPYNISCVAYAGYMSIVTKPLIKAFIGVNVHPADLSIMEHGKRKYTGAHVVRDAILAGATEIRATTHLVEEIVDDGRILMISAPVIIPPGTTTDQAESYQNKLKETGDWIIFPKTLEYISEGRFSQDETGKLYFDEKIIFDGVRL